MENIICLGFFSKCGWKGKEPCLIAFVLSLPLAIKPKNVNFSFLA